MVDDRVSHNVRKDGQRLTWASTPGMPLSARESLVCHLVSEGMTNKQIAAELSIGVPSVKTHLVNAFRKLQVSSRLELALLVRKERNTPERAVTSALGKARDKAVNK